MFVLPKHCERVVFVNKPKWTDANERDVDKPNWQFVIQTTPQGKQVCKGLDVEDAKPSVDVQGHLEDNPSSTSNNVPIEEAGATVDKDENNIGEKDEETDIRLGIDSDSVNLYVDHFGITDLLEGNRLFLDRNQ